MNEVLIVGGMAIATFAIRYIMFGASSRIVLSPTLLNALRYVPPVVLTAIVVPEVLLNEGSLAVGYENARLVGASTAILVSLLTKNLLLTIVLGMATFFCWQTLLGLLV
ncbi:Branched-chain amino acid transport protein (AzlD) [Synechococcus sp. PCC 7335]|uniref:AzlD domain-containing protein n=1 Tax=Synechococcus sp. (strain ATCC 29403 / PCC 7335) TaxID=91464 RepID=UPI00017ECEB5|nr:AzlD domain-containing protein [Synechococcus sp. PCC 7335]EDX85868.1 Branched-chain amino acid transport protein (AzlD) [Synechococcus sp. PCC 7335]